MNAKSGDRTRPQSTSIVKAPPKKSAIPMQCSSNKASVNVEEVDLEEESVQTFLTSLVPMMTSLSMEEW